MSALKLTAGKREDPTAADAGKKEVALPSYLRDFTGDEDENDKKKHEDTRAKKYAVDMFLTANHNIGMKLFMYFLLPMLQAFSLYF